QSAEINESGRQTQYRGASEGSRRTRHASSPEKSNEHREKSRRRGNQTSAPIGNSESLVADYHEPVEQWRFVQVRLTMEHGHKPVPGLEHLSRNLGITRLFRLLERTTNSREEKQAGANHQEQKLKNCFA